MCVLGAVVSGGVSLLCALIIYKAWELDFGVPIGGIKSDIIGAHVTARDIINGDWVYYSSSTFPYKTEYISGPVGHTLHAVFMWMISLFCKDPVLLVNIYFLLGFF